MSSSKTTRKLNVKDNQATAAEGLVALRSLGEESTDGVAVAKGILGGLMWIVETSRQFKSNKAEWAEFAAYILALRDDVETAVVEYKEGVPPRSLVLDVKKLHKPLTTIAEEMNKMAKRSDFSKFLQKSEDSQKIANFRQSMTATILKFNIVRLDSIEPKLDTLIPSSQEGPNSRPSPSPNPNVKDESDGTILRFTTQVTKDLWPEFNPGEGTTLLSDPFLVNFPDSWNKRWANGEETGGQFGKSVFPIQQVPLPPGKLPVRLFDLWTNQVVKTSMIEGGVRGYTIISHAQGQDLLELDGSVYGVEWNIPIQSKAKLDQILKAARIIGGLRYVWIDILCLDQRPNDRRETELAKIRDYYSNAAGCLVWLENTLGGHDWLKALTVIEEINHIFNMDKSGIPTTTFDMMGNIDMDLGDGQVLALVQKILTLEAAPWFGCVGTLQEAVIPDSIYFCTPERYLLGGAVLFVLLGLCGKAANDFTAMGLMSGTAITHYLQKSEAWKIMRMRQLWRQRRVGYWQLSQAIRSRKAKDERDMIIGVLGLVEKTPSLDYNKSAAEFYRELWKEAVGRGEFGALCFLGEGYGRGVPNKECIGLIASPSEDSHNVVENHQLSIRPNGIQLDNVGIDTVASVHHVIAAYGSLTTGLPSQFLDLPLEVHVDIAKACGVPADIVAGRVCPGSLAALYGKAALSNTVSMPFGAEFKAKYDAAIPKSELMWIQIGMLLQACAQDKAVVVIRTASSEPQLAVVTEKLEGFVVAVTPSSYVDRPGEGCLICQLTANGELKKLGVGIGRKVKANSRISALLI